MPKIVDLTVTYEAVAPHERNTIIVQINSGWRPDSFPQSGIKEKWWDINKPGHPESKFPTRIYLLGKGTPDDLFEMYQRKYPDDPMIRSQPSGERHQNVFANYIRELVRQGIFKISNP